MSDIEIPPELKERLTPLDTEAQKASLEAVKHDRLVAVFQLTHEHCCDDPFVAAPRFAAVLATTEQPWVRRVRVGAAWVPLDLGWLAGHSGHILITNTGKSPRTKEEAENIQNYVSLGVPGVLEWDILPGQFHFGYMRDTSTLMVRAVGDPTEITIQAIPR